jgi:hypothetical protein
VAAELTQALLDTYLSRLQAGESAAVAVELSEMHPADAAEVLNELGHSGMLAVLAALVAGGADPAVPDLRGQTPLHQLVLQLSHWATWPPAPADAGRYRLTDAAGQLAEKRLRALLSRHEADDA